MKVFLNGSSHMTKMAATPIHVYGKKTFKNLLHQKQKADVLGAWCVALKMVGLQSLFK